MREDYSFEDGLFSGCDAEARKYDKTSWNYELDENGFAKRDTTLQHPRCVWNLLKQHVSRYTPEVDDFFVADGAPGHPAGINRPSDD